MSSNRIENRESRKKSPVGEVKLKNTVTVTRKKKRIIQERKEETAKHKDQNKNYAKKVQSPKTQMLVNNEEESRTYIPTPPFPQREKKKKRGS